jgi:superfamily I DNA/RNA helicase
METNKIIGAAGSGKTSFLLNIVESIKQPVAYITFTKAAIGEAKDRVKNTSTEFFRTMHSLCYKLLNIKQGMMLDFELMSNFQKQMGNIGYEVSFFFDEENYQEKRSIPLYLNKLSVNLTKPVEEIYNKGSYDVSLKDVKYVIDCYNQFKAFHNVIDFDDLLLQAVKLESFTVPETVFLDEAQDLTVLQWEVFNHIFKKSDKYIVGDDCQCLYHWAGVDINRFIDYPYDKLTILDKSYRVPKDILFVANTIYNRIKNKIEREVKPVNEGGKVGFVNNIKFVEFNTTESYFILIRNWFLKSEIVSFFTEKGIPYILNGVSSVNKRDMKAIYNYERARSGKEKSDEKLLKDYCNGVYKNQTWYEAFKYLDSDKNIYYREILRNGFRLNHDKIEITTIHKSKGREADNVILIQDVSSKVFDNIKSDSEHKCFYVGVTRARKSLTLVRPDTNKYYGV